MVVGEILLRPDDSRKFCSYLSQEGIEYEAYRPDIKNIDSSVIVARELGGIGRIVGYQDYVEFILAALKELDQLVPSHRVREMDILLSMILDEHYRSISTSECLLPNNLIASLGIDQLYNEAGYSAPDQSEPQLGLVTGIKRPINFDLWTMTSTRSRQFHIASLASGLVHEGVHLDQEARQPGSALSNKAEAEAITEQMRVLSLFWFRNPFKGDDINFGKLMVRLQNYLTMHEAGDLSHYRDIGQLTGIDYESCLQG